MKLSKSKKNWEFAQKYLVGGVNSPVRSFNSVDLEPIFIKKAKKCYVFDEDDNQYLDCLNSWGPNILGHSNSIVIKKLKKQMVKGLSYGCVTKIESQLASFIVKNIPHIDLIRFVNSGTEAVMTAIRLARGITKKNKIIKFDGCYHGHSDSVLVKAGSGLITKTDTARNSDGITQATISDTLVLPLADEQLFTETIKNHSQEIAAVIIEPLPANSGLLIQKIEFLQLIEKLCKKHHILFILDEVISGFRLGFTGYAGKYSLSPDIITYGKIIGGGLPVGAIAGKKKILQHLAPLGNIYQAGTLSGNPLAMYAGLATLEQLQTQNVYSHLDKLANYFKQSFIDKVVPIRKNKKFDIKLVQENSIFWFCISPKDKNQIPITSSLIWSEASRVYKKLFALFIQNNIYMAPSAYEVGFLSYPMKKKHIDKIIKTLMKF